MVKFKWRYIPKLVLGVLFCISAILKAVSVEHFELYIFSLSVTSYDVSSILARLLISFELLLGIGLISNCYHRPVTILCALSLILFSAFLIWRITLDDSTNCHCFGDIIELKPSESIIKNIIFFLLLIPAWKNDIYSHTPKLWITGLAITAVTTSVFLTLPPDCLLRNHRNASQEINNSLLCDYLHVNQLDSGIHMLCFYSTDCPYCHNCAGKIAGIISRNNVPMENILVVFMDKGENKTAKDTFFDKYGLGLHVNYTSLSPLDFIPLTNGSMPLVVIIKDSTILKEYDYITVDETEIVSLIGKHRQGASQTDAAGSLLNR